MTTGGFFEFQQRVARRPSTAAAPPPADAAPITVSQLTAKIDKAIKGGLPASLLVKGEVSNLRPNASSGHLYLTLKDATSCIPCVMWKSDAARLRFQPRSNWPFDNSRQGSKPRASLTPNPKNHCRSFRAPSPW